MKKLLIVLLFLSLIFGYATASQSKDSYYKQKILGVWIENQSELSEKDANNYTTRMKGETIYLKNGESSFQGMFSLGSDTETMTFNAWITSKWQIENGHLCITVIDVEFIPVSEKSTGLPEELYDLSIDFKESLENRVFFDEIIKLNDDVLIIKDELHGTIQTSVKKKKAPIESKQ